MSVLFKTLYSFFCVYETNSTHLLMACTELMELSKSKQVPLRTGAGLEVRGRPERNTMEAAESRDRRNCALSKAEGTSARTPACKKHVGVNTRKITHSKRA